VAGINITHPDRIISDVGGITKRDLAEYYAAVAPVFLPNIVGAQSAYCDVLAASRASCFLST
jgi:DNA primase